jgi:hypothetical protein
MTANGSRYRVLKWATCPHCGGRDDGCANCYCGQIQVESDLLDALRDLGVIDQLGVQQVVIEELQTKMSVLTRSAVHA